MESAAHDLKGDNPTSETAKPLAATPEVPHYVGHRERLRKRLMESKRGTFPDYEMLELLLALAKPRGDVKPMAKTLLARFGSLSRVIHAQPQQLKAIKGVGEAVIASFRLMQEMAAHLVKEEMLERPILESWKSLLDYCRITMGYISTEQFRIIYLDKRNRVIVDDLQEAGTIDHTILYPREVLKRALAVEACAVILVHNHPSGNIKPSKADIDLTHSIMRSLSTIGIVLHDHVIITHAGHYSFKSHGLI